MLDYEGIGRRLRCERERIQLSQQDFAEKAGVSRRSQAAYESTGKFAVDYLESIERMGVDTLFVVTGSESTVLLHPIEAFSLRVMRRLSVADHLTVMRMAMGMLATDGVDVRKLVDEYHSYGDLWQKSFLKGDQPGGSTVAQPGRPDRATE